MQEAPTALANCKVSSNRQPSSTPVMNPAAKASPAPDASIVSQNRSHLDHFGLPPSQGTATPLGNDDRALWIDLGKEARLSLGIAESGHRIGFIVIREETSVSASMDSTCFRRTETPGGITTSRTVVSERFLASRNTWLRSSRSKPRHCHVPAHVQRFRAIEYRRVDIGKGKIGIRPDTVDVAPVFTSDVDNDGARGRKVLTARDAGNIDPQALRIVNHQIPE